MPHGAPAGRARLTQERVNPPPPPPSSPPMWCSIYSEAACSVVTPAFAPLATNPDIGEWEFDHIAVQTIT